MPENKHLKFLLVIVYLALFYFFVTYALPNIITLILPIILAFAVAFLSQPIVVLLNKNFKVPRAIAAFLSLLVVISAVTFIIVLLINRLIYEISNLIEFLPLYAEQTQLLIDKLIDQVNLIYDTLPLNIANNIDTATSKMMEGIMSQLPSVTSWTIRATGAFAAKMPNFLLFLITFLLACYFFTADYNKVVKVIFMQIPEKWHKKIKQIKMFMILAFGKYLRGTLIMMQITFVVLLIGFLIMEVKYALLFALAIALLDALPVFGVGTALLPWSLLSMLSGDLWLGIELIIMYLVVVVVRSVFEPKVIGDSMGMHPIITLVGLYAGYKLFGAVGMICMPMVLMIVISAHNAGIISIWKQ